MAKNEFTLKVGGKEYDKWKSINITRSIEQIARTFALDYTETWLEDGKMLPIRENMKCTIDYNGETIIDGYTIDNESGYDAKSHTTGVSGLSCPGDMCDCSAVCSPGQWWDNGLVDIAKAICQPFKIGASADVQVEPKMASFTIQDGETAFEALNRLARSRGLIIVSDAGANIIFTRAGSKKVSTKIELGVNILTGNRKSSTKDRHSEYILKSQIPGSDDSYGKELSQTKKSQDDAMDRYRPLIIQAEDALSGSELERRAKWERNTRAGRAHRFTWSVTGWEHSSGLWEPNSLIVCKDPRLGVDKELLAVTVNYTKDADGKRTEIELCAKEAFDVKDLAAKKAKDPWAFR
jgi:prophage tail gpP-like protein